MNKSVYTFTILSMLFLFSNSVFAAGSKEVESMSTAMLGFMGFAAIALFFTYVIWKMKNNRKRSLAPKVVNRGPVKKTASVYYRKKEIKDAAKA